MTFLSISQIPSQTTGSTVAMFRPREDYMFPGPLCKIVKTPASRFGVHSWNLPNHSYLGTIYQPSQGLSFPFLNNDIYTWGESQETNTSRALRLKGKPQIRGPVDRKHIESPGTGASRLLSGEKSPLKSILRDWGGQAKCPPHQQEEPS